jgi:hypothetical protein
MIPLLQSLKELRFHQNKGLVGPGLFSRLKAKGITVVMFRNRDGTFSDLCVT